MRRATSQSESTETGLQAFGPGGNRNWSGMHSKANAACNRDRVDVKKAVLQASHVSSINTDNSIKIFHNDTHTHTHVYLTEMPGCQKEKTLIVLATRDRATDKTDRRNTDRQTNKQTNKHVTYRPCRPQNGTRSMRNLYTKVKLCVTFSKLRCCLSYKVGWKSQTDRPMGCNA